MTGNRRILPCFAAYSPGLIGSGLLVLLAGCGGGGGGGNPQVNHAPSATAFASTQYGLAPLAVSFDGHTSSDPDGDSLTYAWDFDNDGTADATTVLASFSYATTGTFTARLTVRDPGGLSASANLSVEVAQSVGGNELPSIVLSEPQANSAGHFSAGLIGGIPAVAWFDVTSQQLQFRRASDDSGLGWAGPVLVRGGLQQGSSNQLSLAEVAGRPAIAMQDKQTGLLEFYRSADALGTTWEAPVTIAGTALESAGLNVELLVADGNPAAIFTILSDGLKSELFYQRANDSTGTSWSGISKRLSGDADQPRQFSAELIDGNPALAWLDSTGNSTQYMRAAGTSWPLPREVVARSGNTVSLRFAELGPLVAIGTTDNLDMKYFIHVVSSTDIHGASWQGGTDIDSGAASVGASCLDMLIHGNEMRLAYDVSDKPGLARLPSFPQAELFDFAPLEVTQEGQLALGNGGSGMFYWVPDFGALEFARLDS